MPLIPIITIITYYFVVETEQLADANRLECRALPLQKFTRWMPQAVLDHTTPRECARIKLAQVSHFKAFLDLQPKQILDPFEATKRPCFDRGSLYLPTWFTWKTCSSFRIRIEQVLSHMMTIISNMYSSSAQTGGTTPVCLHNTDRQTHAIHS